MTQTHTSRQHHRAQPRRAASTGPAALAELLPTGLGRAELLLRAVGAVQVGGSAGGPELSRPVPAERLAALFLEAGALPSAGLLRALREATPGQRQAVHDGGLEAVRRARGAQPSLPQLASFAERQVMDTAEHFLTRLAAFLGLGDEEITSCALYRNVNAHLPGTWGLGADPAPVSRGCATGRLGTAVRGACEVCHLRVGDPTELLRLAHQDRDRRADRALPHRAVDVLPTGEAARGALLAALTRLAGQATPPSATEREDLVGLTALLVSGELSPAVTATELLDAALQTGLPQREVRARLVGTLLRLDPARTGLLARLQAGVGLLPADLLRILDVMGGGDGTLARPAVVPEAALAGSGMAQVQPPARGSTAPGARDPRLPRAPHLRLPVLSRPLRRAVAQALEACLTDLETQGQTGATLAWEGVAGSPEAFKRLFAALHLHERGGRDAPRAAALAHLLSGRGRRQDEPTLAAGPARAAEALLNRAGTGHLRTLMGQVETALAAGDLARALKLLLTRPGLLARMADRLLRLEAGAEGRHAPLTVGALTAAAPHLTPSLVAGLHAHFEHRDRPDPHRSFKARGQGATRQIGDTRTTLARPLITRVQSVLEGELIRRGTALPPLGELIVAPDVLGLRLSASARAASAGNEGLAPGSRIRLTPAGVEAATTARLFLHWAQKEGAGSIDLDLSAIAVDAQGRQVDLCSFSNLRAAGMVHSGDLRSAPLPAGATEYIDLDLAALRARGVWQVLASVRSYTSVPFERMERAACGVMSRTRTGGTFREMDPATTRVRFELRGEATSKIIAALDLAVPGEEHLILVDRQDDRLGFLVAEDDRQNAGALALAERGEGVGLDLPLAAHAARAGVVRVGEYALARVAGETPEEFAHRVRGALQALRLGLHVEAQEQVTATPGLPALHVLEQSRTVLPQGDTLVEVHPGVAQTAGATVQDLRWLMASLSPRSEPSPR